MSKRNQHGKQASKTSQRRRVRTAGRRKRNLPAIAGVAVLLLAVAVALAIRLWPTPEPTAQVGSSSTVSAELLAYGEEIYQANCAVCHGPQGEGYAQPGLPAPALDDSEHAWHHPDEQIIALLRQGGVRMPAIGAEWSDQDIEAVLSYVKQWWTPQQREFQPGTIGE